MKTIHKIIIAKFLFRFVSLMFKQKKIRKINDVLFDIDLSEGIDLNLFIFRSFEHEVVNAALKIINKKKINSIIDIGANNGIQTLQFAKNLHNSIIYSIEPTYYSFEKLKKNISLNHNFKDRIKIFNNFIGFQNDTIPTHVYSSWNLISKDERHPKHAGIKKEINKNGFISLDTFVKKNSINNLSLIKLDVDGFEYEVLKSGKNILKKKNSYNYGIGPILICKFKKFI